MILLYFALVRFIRKDMWRICIPGTLILTIGCSLDPTGRGVFEDIPLCGNGVAEDGESCDLDDLRGLSCNSLGMVGLYLACTADCELDSSRCVVEPQCGNGVAEEGESCDGSDLRNQGCRNLTGHQNGDLSCNDDCQFDTSLCSTCGDGQVTGLEQCDLDNLDGNNCEFLGYDGGQLACNGACEWNVAECLVMPENWLDEQWRFRKSLTIVAAAVGDDLTHFPLLVNLSDADVAARTQSHGEDLVFTSADGQTRLDHEVELYNPARGWLTAWVRVEHLSGSETTKLYLYYGNSGCADQQNRESVWDEHYVGVWHLDEPYRDEESGAAHLDATAYANHAIQNGNHVGESIIGMGQVFDGVDDFIEVLDTSDFVLSDSDCTISAWMRTDAVSPMGILTAVGPSETNATILGVNYPSELLGLEHGVAGYLAGTTIINDGEWHHIAWVQHRDDEADQELWELYVDGVLDSSQHTATAPNAELAELFFGRSMVESLFPNAFRGVIDEVRISNVARSAAWIWTSERNQNAPRAFIAIGQQEAITVAALN